MKGLKEFLRKKGEQMFDGELTLQKTDFWMIAMIVFLLGVLYGLLKAPLTHGINVSFGNNNGNTILPEDDCECVGCCECDDEEEE